MQPKCTVPCTVGAKQQEYIFLIKESLTGYTHTCGQMVQEPTFSCVKLTRQKFLNRKQKIYEVKENSYQITPLVTVTIFGNCYGKDSL